MGQTAAIPAANQQQGTCNLYGGHETSTLFRNFDTPKHWKRSPRMLAYAALFAPVAMVGHWTGQGDWLYLSARRV